MATSHTTSIGWLGRLASSLRYGSRKPSGAHTGRTYLNDIHRRLELALGEEQRLRPARTVDEWITAERQRMLDAVNGERALLGKGPLRLADVERVEQIAVGHFDYTHKFTLYCAELVGSP